MKHFFLILAIFGFSVSFAQKLEYNDGKIFQDGEQLSSFETKKVMENVSAILKDAGMDLTNVVKTTIFIMNMGDFARINAVYGSYFDEATAPARETVQVACLPKNVNVEISMIAVK